MSQTQVLSIETCDNEAEDYDGTESFAFILLEKTIFELKKGCNKIGRDPEMCSIVINNNTVSKLHCIIEWEGVNGTFIYDNGSTNQTRLGKKYLRAHCRYRLEGGDLITMGNVTVKFLVSIPCLNQNSKNQAQWLQIKDFGINLSNVEKIFDMETQVILPKANGCSLEKFTPQPGTSKEIQWEKIFKVNKSANALSVIDKSKPEIIIKKELKLEHQQICLIENLENSNIFNMETQYEIKSSQKTNNHEKNNNLNEITVLNHTVTATGLSEPGTSVQILPNEVSAPSSLKTQEAKNIAQNKVNVEEEKELILNDYKLIQSFEENFSLEEEDENTVVYPLLNKNSCSLEPSKGLNESQNHNNHQVLIDNGTSLVENISNHTEHYELKNSRGNSINHNLINASSDTSDMRQNFQNGGTFKNEQCKIPDIEKSCHVDAVEFSEENTFSKANREDPESDSDSCLEITIENEENNEMINNSQVTSILLKELQVPRSASSGVFEKEENKRDFEIKIRAYCPPVRAKPSTPQNPVNIDDRTKETQFTGKNASSKHRMEKFNDDSSPSVLHRSNFSPDTQDFIDTDIPRGKPFKKNYNEAAEDGVDPLEIGIEIKNDFASLTLTKDFSSIVPESSDDDTTLSDLDFVDDTPYFKRGKSDSFKTLSRTVNRSITSNAFSQSPPAGTSQILNDKPYSRIRTKTLSFDDTDDYSYVFDVVNDAKNFEKKCPLETKNNGGGNEESDSDTADIIDCTPPKLIRSFSKNESFYISVESRQKNICGRNERRFIFRNSDNDSSDQSSHASAKTPPTEEKTEYAKEVNAKIMNKRMRKSENVIEIVPSKKFKRIHSGLCENEDNDNERSKKELKRGDGDFWNISALASPFGSVYLSESNKGSEIYTKRNQRVPNNIAVNNFVEKSRENMPNRSSTAHSHGCRSLQYPQGISRGENPRKSNGSNSGNEKESKFERSCMSIAFTGFDSACLNKIIEDLGGRRTEDLHGSQVLVTDQARRTVKFLCAIGLSIPITSPKWLLASKRKNEFLNPWNYILKCEASEKKWNFDLRETLEKSKKNKLLKGFSIFATENVRPPVEDILTIVRCSGGIPLYDRPNTWTSQTIVVSCLEDEKFWPPWRFNFVSIVHYEFILSGILQQNLDFKTYKLR